ncbi:MAG TPA: VOC family protein [Candidatus Limnocylindrales bacterium]|nr:VOC family protein [Candidatus Limnocylindrales bacterium]
MGSTMPNGDTMRFEATTLPVTDVDRAKDFYQRLGWRLDIDFEPAPGQRGVQFTPPGSRASIQFGEGSPEPEGPLTRLLLVVDDIEATRDDLIDRGVRVSDVFHNEPGLGPIPGVDPDHRSYLSLASFNDPDGNQWVLQEIKERLPGRGGAKDGADLADLLLETSLRHSQFEAVAPKHNWWDWYAAYMDAREEGLTPDESSTVANRYMADVKHIMPA